MAGRLLFIGCGFALLGGVGSFHLPTRTGRVAVYRQDQCNPMLPLPNVRSIKRYDSVHTSKYLSPSSGGQTDSSLILRTSKAIRASSWLSWWSQLILTVISTVTFAFARNVMSAQAGTNPVEFSKVAAKFFLPGVGIFASSISLVWTWGERRLSSRLIRRNVTSQVETANLLRRVIKVGVTLNLIGLLSSVLGAQYIIGTLAAKSLTNFVGFGGGLSGGVVPSQTLQPLDVLVVQANTNILTSHFVSLVCLLWLVRFVDLLDPPSLDDDTV